MYSTEGSVIFCAYTYMYIFNFFYIHNNIIHIMNNILQNSMFSTFFHRYYFSLLVIPVCFLVLLQSFLVLLMSTFWPHNHISFEYSLFCTIETKYFIIKKCLHQQLYWSQDPTWSTAVILTINVTFFIHFLWLAFLLWVQLYVHVKSVIGYYF